MLHVPAAVAVLAVAAAPIYSAKTVQQRFHAVTGTSLAVVGSATTPDVTTLGPGAASERRFGRFELYVLRPATMARTRRAILQGARADAQGVYWVPDQAGGIVAMKVYGPNLVLGWFPKSGLRRLDARFLLLDRALRGL